MAQITHEGGFLRRLSLRKDRLEKKFKGRKILSWERTDNSILAEKNQNELQKSDGFLVKEYELALLVHEGKIIELVYPGIYEVQDINFAEVIWISREEIDIKWGTKARTRDHVTFGVHGTSLFQIIVPEMFLTNFTHFLPGFVLKKIEFREKIRNYLCQAFINMTSSYELEILLKENYRVLEDKIRLNFVELLRWGISLLTIGIMGYDIPRNYQILLEGAIQKQLIEARSSLQKDKLKGGLEVQKMKHEAFMEIEFDKIKLDAERSSKVENPRNEAETREYFTRREVDALVESANQGQQ